MSKIEKENPNITTVSLSDLNTGNQNISSSVLYSDITVVTAKKLDDKTKNKIEKIFRAKHSDTVNFIYEVDFAVLGGCLIIDGEKYYDATIEGQLARLKKELTTVD